ncbi:hypothetical protein [Saccharothrix saharensis]|uniref:hypothetical protein n=1 Tax=Saccharothrix saharensis TaxID=571190 RepID=UPI00114EC77C|nr:hypothetical protein [Saccharothrix saharensis]
MRYTDGTSGSVGPEERREQLEELTAHVRRFAGKEPFRPGDRLIPTSQQSVAGLYRPYRQ